MTPKQEADELINEFIPNMPYANKTQWANRCALIAVDKILNLPVVWYSKELADRDSQCPHEGTEEFWQEVKKIIQHGQG